MYRDESHRYAGDIKQEYERCLPIRNWAKIGTKGLLARNRFIQRNQHNQAQGLKNVRLANKHHERRSLRHNAKGPNTR